MRIKRLRNAPLPRHHQALEYSNHIIAKCVLQNVYGRVSWALVGEEKEDELRSIEERRERERYWSAQVAHWKQNPISHVHKESGCTIRRGFSGGELFIDSRELSRIGTLRQFYQEVRTKLQLLPKHSLHLRFVGSRRFGIQWEEHTVGCDDSECSCYLCGSIIQSLVHD